MATGALANTRPGAAGKVGSSSLESANSHEEGPPATFSIPVGAAPSAVAYDPSEGEIFVANSGSDNVSVINDTLGTIVGTVSVGSGPSAVLSLGGDVFVANELSDNISVINGSSLHVVASWPVGTHPDALAAPRSLSTERFDTIWVADAGSNNVTVISLATNSTVANIPVGNSPAAILGSEETYVANAGSGTLTVVDPRNFSVNTTSTVGTTPVALVASGSEPNTDFQSYLYVANARSDNLSVINVGSAPGNLTAQPFASIPVGSGPDALAFDPDSGRLYVADGGSDNISIVSGLRPIPSGFSVGTDPAGLVYDNGDGCLYVANAGSDNVSVACDLVPPSGHGSFSVSAPGAIAYDARNSHLYVSTGQNEVQVLNASTGQPVGSEIPVGSSYPDWTRMLYDPTNGNVYVTNWLDYNISVINGSTNSVSATIALPSTGAYSYPVGLTYDSANGFLYVRMASYYVIVVNTSSEQVVGTINVGWDASSRDLVYDSVNREVYVDSWNNSGNGTGVVRAINGSTSAINGSNLLLDPNVTLQRAAGAIAVDPSNGLVFVFSGGSANDWPNGNLSIINGSTDRIVPVTIPLPYWGTGAIYDNSTGLMYWLGDWNVTVVDPANESLVGATGVGELPAGITYDPDNGVVYVTNPQDNNITVIYPNATAGLRPVVFHEGGATAGTTWGVTLDGTTEYANSSSLVFRVPTGPYAYSVETPSGYLAVPSGDHVIVSNAPVEVPVTFVEDSSPGGSGAAYPITFEETGLPLQSSWSVTLNGSPRAATGGSIEFDEPNGTYPFEVGSVSGYGVSPGSGSITVNGTSVNRTVTFTSNIETFPVVFEVTGLPTGASWMVNLSGVTRSGIGDLTFPGLANGTYFFQVPIAGGYSPTPSDGSIVVHGSSASQTIGFQELQVCPVIQATGPQVPANPCPPLPHTTPPTTFLGIPNVEGYALLGGLIAAVVIGILALVIRTRRSLPP
jgi:YVTN family beta-propeller protein